MVGVKDTEMPKYCNYWDAETRKWIECPIYKSCKHHTSNIDVKPSDCPLVEIITCKDCNQVNCSNHAETCDPEEYRPDFYCGDAKRRQ